MTTEDRLYGLPLDEFIAERDRLSKELRKAGDREAAERVRKLRKPSVPAWAVNQLARRSTDAIEALLAAGDEARSAQEEVLGGGDRSRLTAAVQAEREAVDSLAAHARGILEAEGRKPTEQVLDRVRATLHAASTDDQVRDLVRAGRLVADAEPVGFGGVPAGGAAVAPRAKPKRTKADSEAARKRKEEAATARRGVRTAEQRATRAAKRLAEAEAELEEARSEAEQAETDLRDARDALARLEEHSG